MSPDTLITLAPAGRHTRKNIRSHTLKVTLKMLDDGAGEKCR